MFSIVDNRKIHFSRLKMLTLTFFDAAYRSCRSLSIMGMVMKTITEFCVPTVFLLTKEQTEQSERLTDIARQRSCSKNVNQAT